MIFLRYLSSSVPLIGFMAAQSPGFPPHKSVCMSLKAWAKAITASLTNCSCASNTVFSLVSFSLVVQRLLYRALYGVFELFGYLQLKWFSQNSAGKKKGRVTPND